MNNTEKYNLIKASSMLSKLVPKIRNNLFALQGKNRNIAEVAGMKNISKHVKPGPGAPSAFNQAAGSGGGTKSALIRNIQKYLDNLTVDNKLDPAVTDAMDFLTSKKLTPGVRKAVSKLDDYKLKREEFARGAQQHQDQLNPTGLDLY